MRADILERSSEIGAAALRECLSETVDDAGAQFDALYKTYTPLLRKIAARKFNIPPRDIDDLVQDVFATYLANRANVRDVHTYVIGAICHASRQYRRRDAASATLSLSRHDLHHQIADDDVAEGVIRNLVLRATLARLGASCRETLAQFYLHGERPATIAAQRQTSANYISRLLNYCRNRARAIYTAMQRQT
jgi:RNA polymerase sigma factor (sigma-70 family)